MCPHWMYTRKDATLIAIITKETNLQMNLNSNTAGWRDERCLSLYDFVESLVLQPWAQSNIWASERESQ